MHRLVVVVPLQPGARDAARALLDAGPPFDLEGSQFERHEVFLTSDEAVFVFEAAERPATLHVRAEDPSVWKAAAKWKPLMAGRPRTAETVFAWERDGA